MNKYIKEHKEQMLIALTLLVLLIYAVVFSLERILSADTADYMVKLVNEPKFYTGSYRFISYFTQFIPLLLVYVKAPFNVVLQSYSFNLMLFHVVVIATISFWLKDIKSASIATLGLLLTSVFLFYYPVSELQMGLTLSVFLYAYAKKYLLHTKVKPTHLIVALLVAVTVIYSHPLAISFVGFMLLYLFVEKEIKYKNFMLLGIVVVLVFVSKYLFFSVINDSNNVDFLSSLKLFPLQSFYTFWGILFTKMYLFLAVFIIGIMALILQKKWVLLLVYVLYFYANFYFSLSKWGEAINWYSIHLCLPFFYLAVFIFVETVFRNYSTKKYLIFIFPLFLVSLIQIPDNKKFNQARISIIDKYVSAAIDQNIKKGFVSPQDEGNQPSHWFWALEYESLVLSKYKYQKTTTVIYKSNDQIANTKNQKELFLTVWGSIPISIFNKNYFQFNEAEYRKIALP